MGRPAPAALGADGIWRFDGLAHFIDSYGEVCDLLHDLDDFRRVALELCGDLCGARGPSFADDDLKLWIERDIDGWLRTR